MKVNKHPPCAEFHERNGCGSPGGAKVWRTVLMPATLALLLVVCARGAQQPAARRDLTELSLEDLMDVEVTSVARKEQKVSQTASAVYVITEEQILRSGLTSIPELLRMAPGVHVARLDSNKWAISIRGFNNRFSDKLLVMIDGRSVYTPLFSGVYWDAQDMMIEDIERIEVIRGPGGTMWGSNAVNGVINIITKHARDTHGTLLTTGGGTREGGFGGLRSGAELKENLHIRAYSKYLKRNAQFPASQAPGKDDWDVLRSGFRMDWEYSDRDSFMVTGNTYEGDARSNVTIPSTRFPFQELREDPISFRGSDVQGRWTRKLSEKSVTALRVNVDSFDRSDTFLKPQRLNTVDVDFQHRLDLSSRNQLMWGLGFRSNRDDLRSTDIVIAAPESRTTRLYNTFLQDDLWLLDDRLLLTIGSKFEHNSYTGWEVQPSASLLWNRNPNESAWFSIARAVRIPFRANHDFRLNLSAFPGPAGNMTMLSIFGNSEFRSEELLAYQSGYRVRPNKRLFVDFAAFYNVYDNLQGTETGLPFVDQSLLSRPLVIPTRFANNADGETYGAELAATWQATDRWSLDFSYSRLELRTRTKALGEAANLVSLAFPKHQLHAGWRLDLPARLQFDAGYYFVGKLQASEVPSYHRVDARMGWKVSRQIEVSVGLQNLLDNRHLEIVPDAWDQPTEIGRNVYGKVSWRF